MSDALTTFFDAWGQPDAEQRAAMIANACFEDCLYSDPRSGGRLYQLPAITEYVGQFSANAPGWTAKIVKADEIAGYTRAIVAFGGMGPDGNEMVQHGTYFADAGEDGKLNLIVGFVGLGTLE